VAESKRFLLFQDDKIEEFKLKSKKTGYFSAAGYYSFNIGHPISRVTAPP
jgi:hypothetical protein